VADEKTAEKYLADELKRIEDTAGGGELVERIGERFSRVHLREMEQNGLALQTLLKLFIITRRIRKESTGDFEVKLDCMVDLCAKGELPFSKEESETAAREYKEAGMNAVHHTAEFNLEYAPAYRVVSNELCRYMPLFTKIDRMMAERESVTVAIEGKCTSGKTTLANYLGEIYDCNVFSMDSFFLQPYQRTEERLSQPGGNVDYERFKAEVLDKLKEGREFSYRPYDCSVQKLVPPQKVMPKRLNIIEGVYSMHPTLADSYDLSVYLDISYDEQLARLAKRNSPEMQARFINEWIPLENMYFERLDVKSRCDLII
jgi:uridine kinase